MRLCDVRHYHSLAFNSSIKLSYVNGPFDNTVNPFQSN